MNENDVLFQPDTNCLLICLKIIGSISGMNTEDLSSFGTDNLKPVHVKKSVFKPFRL